MSPVRAVVLLLLIAVFSNAAENSTRVRPQITRTSLHVARSLNPLDSEVVRVRSRNGEMASIIVKRREGRNSFPTTQSSIKRVKNHESHVEEDKSAPVPEPVEIRSGITYVKGDANSKKKAREISTVTVENGVPVIEGVREPDSPEDKYHTWRNAKVINGVLVPYKQSLNGEIPLKKQENKSKPEKQEVTLSSYYNANAKNPLVFEEEDLMKTQWKGLAETIPVHVPKPISFPEQDKNQAKIIEYIMKINEKEIQNRRKSGRSIDYPKENTAERRMDENVDENEEPIWINSQPKEIWTKEGKISIADRRVDRMEDVGYDEEDTFVPIAPVQARLLQPKGVSNYPSSSIYSSQPSRVSFAEGVRTPVLQYAHPELGAQPAKIERDAEEEKPKDQSIPSLTYFSNDPYADRSPYAYEPGLVKATELAESSNSEVSNNIGDREMNRRQSIRNIEFTTTSETSSINPDEIDITESPNRLKSSYFPENYHDSYSLGNDNYLQSYQHHSYPGKYSMTKEDYYKWKMSGMSYGNNHNPGYYVKIPDNRPFWEKITDSIKETVQSGVESMKEMTRPVMEPLVEATQRISENLGIPEATAKISNSLGLNQGTGMRTALQEKIGAAASSNPVLLPALGLVGAGAALGLGAVAVGRLLDVNVSLLKRSESGNEPEDSKLQMEHKRALEALQKIYFKNNTGHARHGKSLPEDKVENESKTEFKRLIDESGIEGLDKFHFDLSENADENKSRRRSLNLREKTLQEENEDFLKMIQENRPNYEEIATKLATLGQSNAWKNLPCTLKVFCIVLAEEANETLKMVEDKVLVQIQNAGESSTSRSIEKVLNSAKSRDCSPFVCHRKITR